MTIRRYSEDHDAVYNAQLQRLEDLYNTTGNAMELITSGTLTADSAEISMDLGGVSWAFVMLRAMITPLASAPSTDITLRANNQIANSTIYYNAYLQGLTAGIGGGSTSGTASLGAGDSTSPTLFECTIFPNSLGFTLLGTATAYSGAGPGMVLFRFGGYYTGGSIATSLQIRLYPTAAGSGLMAAGSTYRLEGVRA